MRGHNFDPLVERWRRILGGFLLRLAPTTFPQKSAFLKKKASVIEL
jgi:hypothetical protein